MSTHPYPATCNGHTEAELREQLASPFPEEWIDWKPQSAGWKKGRGVEADTPWVKVLAFIDNRAIQDRLDDVCGIGGWRNEFVPLASGAMLCGLSIMFWYGDGAREWVTKWDGAPPTEIESVKGGLSSAMKRAAIQWGIGRYLYDVEVAFGRIAPSDDWNAKQVTPKDKKTKQDMTPFRWLPPRLPAWAQFGGSGKKGVVSTIQQERGKMAAAALAKTPAADELLPGTKAHFHGHGGKRLRDVPTLELQRAMEKLREVGSEEYTMIVDAIGEVLADRAGAGA